jgi:hypothetical protein
MFRPLLGAALAAALALPALAHDGVHVADVYARASARSGAVFMTITNHAAADDTLIAASTDVAERVELHTHVMDASGVMAMVEVEGGFTIPGGSTRVLQRGGDHIMLLGLTRPLADGDRFTLTLTFARGEVLTVDAIVDNARAPAGDGMQGGGQGGMHGGTHGSGHGAPAP